MSNVENQNTLGELKKFLSTPDRPVTQPEFLEFWNSLSEEEKAFFRKVELS